MNKLADEQRRNTKRFMRVLLIFVVSVAFLLGGYALYAFIAPSHPNYNDLEKAYAKLNTPPTWEVIDEYNVKGNSGKNCAFTNPDVVCPYLSRSLSSASETTQALARANIAKLMNDAGYKPAEECNEVDESVCYATFEGKNGSYKLKMSINRVGEDGAVYGLVLQDTIY